MERQSHEESKVLWTLELASTEKLTLTPEHKKLVDIVTKKIEDYSLEQKQIIPKVEVKDYTQNSLFYYLSPQKYPTLVKLQTSLNKQLWQQLLSLSISTLSHWEKIRLNTICLQKIM